MSKASDDLPGAGQSREHDQLVAGKLERDVPEVVFTGAVDDEPIGAHAGIVPKGPTCPGARSRRASETARAPAIVRPMSSAGPVEPARDVPFDEALRFWVRLGFINFGGPSGQIAIMHDELVERRRWIDEPRFLHALNFAMLLPGPEAHQLAIYVGLAPPRGTRRRRGRGLLPAPGARADARPVLGLRRARRRHVVSAVFAGLSWGVVGIVAAALVRIAGRAITSLADAAIAARVVRRAVRVRRPVPGRDRRRRPPRCAVLAGRRPLRRPRRPRGGRPAGGRAVGATDAPGPGRRARRVARAARARGPRVRDGRSHRRRGGLLRGDVARDVRWRLRRPRVREPGGGRAVRVAHVRRDGRRAQPRGVHAGTADPDRGLRRFGRSVPGPGGLAPAVAGVVGGLVTAWATFVPSFVFIFLGAPSVERLRGRPRLSSALSAITAAVVGVIANLALVFAIGVLFERRPSARIGWHDVTLPVLSEIYLLATAVASGAFVAMWRFKVNVVWVVLGAGLVGLARSIA